MTIRAEIISQYATLTIINIIYKQNYSFLISCIYDVNNNYYDIIIKIII